MNVRSDIESRNKNKINKYKILKLNNKVIDSNISDHDYKSLNNMKKWLTDIKLNMKQKNTRIEVGKYEV